MKKFLPLIVFVAFMSCKKNNIDNTAELLSKSWKMSARTILTSFQGTPLEGSSNNWFSPGTCYSDMIWTYKQDGSFLNESAGSCVPGTSNGIDTLYGKWSLINNSKTIKVEYIAGGFVNFEFKIIELTPTKMIVQRIERTGVAGAQVSDYREIDLLNQYEFIPK